MEAQVSRFIDFAIGFCAIVFMGVMFLGAASTAWGSDAARAILWGILMVMAIAKVTK